MSRPLNIVQVCDHLGWPGSRMHGVKRLFAWMIPRFDRDHFNVSLISLRQPDSSEDTLEARGIDVTYLSKSKFDPTTLLDLLRELDRKQADIVHLHGYWHLLNNYAIRSAARLSVVRLDFSRRIPVWSKYAMT